MTDTAVADRIYRYGPSIGRLVVVLLAVTVVRYVGLATSQIEMVFDEAQYWSWSLEPAWGYFSKPPLIAWLIGLQNLTCGTSEFCARSFVPAIHMATALVVYVVGRRLLSPVVGFWSAILFAFLPGVSFSARLITTDVPLLLCWAVALYALWALRERRSLTMAIMLGVAIGLGLLAKYAMVYFLVCAVVYVAIGGDAWRRLWWPGIVLAGVVAIVILMPNILWNVNNGLITFLHTADNVNWGGRLIRPMEALEFLGGQFLVFGPIPMALLLAIAVRPALLASIDGPVARYLYAFSVPVVALILFQALMSRAHANWAAPAYVAGSILVTAFILARGWRWLIYATLAIHLAAQAALLLADSRAATLRAPFGIDLYSRALGFEPLVERIGAEFETGRYGTLLTDWRWATATSLYYLRDDPPTIVTWPHPVRPYDHYQLTRPLTEANEGPFLLVTRCNRSARLDAGFEQWRLVDTVVTSGGPRRNWVLFLIEADGPRLDAFPPPHCSNHNGDTSRIVDEATLPPRKID